MTNRMKAPLTNAESGGILKPQRGKLVTCSKCHKPGGTLIKVDDHYEHQNKTMCHILWG